MKREDVFQPETSAKSCSPAVAEAVEKRQHQRVPVSLGVDIINIETHACITGRATDFGVGGCYVDTVITFAEGTVVDVFLNSQGHKLRLRALVSYTATGRSSGMGLSFTGASAEAGATLLDWVTGLRREPPQQPEPRPAPQAAAASEGTPAGTLRLQETIGELIALLVRKEMLTPSEGMQLHEKLLR